MRIGTVHTVPLYLHFKGPGGEIVSNEWWLHMRIYTCSLRWLLFCMLRRDGNVNIRKTCIYDIEHTLSLLTTWTRFRSVKVSPRLLFNRENILRKLIFSVKYLFWGNLLWILKERNLIFYPVLLILRFPIGLISRFCNNLKRSFKLISDTMFLTEKLKFFTGNNRFDIERKMEWEIPMVSRVTSVFGKLEAYDDI